MCKRGFSSSASPRCKSFRFPSFYFRFFRGASSPFASAHLLVDTHVITMSRWNTSKARRVFSSEKITPKMDRTEYEMKVEQFHIVSFARLLAIFLSVCSFHHFLWALSFWNKQHFFSPFLHWIRCSLFIYFDCCYLKCFHYANEAGCTAIHILPHSISWWNGTYQTYVCVFFCS